MSSWWSVGHLTVDDIVLPTGETLMGVTGGAVAYSAVGAALSGQAMGMISRIGENYPAETHRALVDAGLPLALTPIEDPCISQWAIYEEDGSRRFLLHPHSGDHDVNAPRPGDFPGWAEVEGLHIAPMPISRQLEWIAAASQRAIPLTLDPHHDSSLDEPQAVWSALAEIHAFVPSELECSRLSPGSVSEAVARFLDAGVSIAAVKQAEKGCTIADRQQIWHVPACSGVTPVDVTGAGDAWCGAFAAALFAGATTPEAACWANAAASVTIEYIGALTPLRDPKAIERMRRRYSALEPRELTRSALTD